MAPPMTPKRPLPDAARKGLTRPLRLTRTGMTAERATRAFWPVWTILIGVLALLMLGAQDVAPLEAVWAIAALSGLALLIFSALGLRRFRPATEAEALARLDATLPGRPIAALTDAQAIGADDPSSRAIWEAHVTRMADRIRATRAVQPDLRISAQDPFALRYAALLALAVALLFGSTARIGSVAGLAPGAGQALASGPSWEGWIEPPAYTDLPSLYLSDLPEGEIAVPEGAQVTIRVYGEVGALSVTESVSNAPDETLVALSTQSDFEVVRSGQIRIDGPGGRTWDIALVPDEAPQVTVDGAPERATGGEFRQSFTAGDDYGVVSGQARIALDMDRIDRRYGLATDPDPRDALTVDLPLPISGDRSDFDGTLVETFSQHPWANLPVTIAYEVTDERGQTGRALPYDMNLAGQRFFDPLAQAVIEQRRALLWSRDNARQVAQLLRAVSWQPADVFSSETLYLRLRTAVRRLETGLGITPLSAERQDEIAAELWAIAEELEFGDLADARERLQRAQERLAEAMENGADAAEIAELMQEMREAMADYIEQLAREGQQQEAEEGAEPQDGQQMSGDQLQEMMDEIQRLMEEGRMAEAQRLMEQLNQMLENMRVTQGQQGQGEGQEAMEGLQDTLRDQQELSDDSFGEMQDGQQGQQGQQGEQGQQGQQGQGQQGQGQQQGQQPDQGQQQGQQGQGGPQSLADRQQALRDELNRQRGNLPGAGTEAGDAAREALDQADRAMEGAEDALREGDTPRALDNQADAMEALREGMRNLGEAMAQEQQQGQGQSQAQGDPNGESRDPLGREAGESGQMGSNEQMLGEDDVRRRAEELLGEIRRRSGEQERPESERDYLNRLLDRF